MTFVIIFGLVNGRPIKLVYHPSIVMSHLDHNTCQHRDVVNKWLTILLLRLHDYREPRFVLYVDPVALPLL